MKLLIVMNSVAGKTEQLGFSGSTIIAARHGWYFISKGIDVTFLTTSQGREYIRGEGIRCRVLETSASKRRVYWWNYLLNFMGSLKHLGKKYDVVYCVTDLFPDVLFTLMCRVKKKIFSCHHQISKDDKWHSKASYYLQKILHYFMQKAAYRIIVPNKLIDLKNKLVVYGASDYRCAESNIKTLINVKQNDIIFIGNYQKIKGFDLLDKIRFGLSKYKIQIWGDTKQIIRGSEKYYRLGDSKICIIPSYHESFSLVAIEAMSMATPVVAWDLPALRSIYEKGMVFARPYDIPDFISKVEYLLNNPEALESLAKEAHEFSKKFGWKTEAYKILSVLQG